MFLMQLLWNQGFEMEVPVFVISVCILYGEYCSHILVQFTLWRLESCEVLLIGFLICVENSSRGSSAAL